MPNSRAELFLEPFVAPELKIERARHHYAEMLDTLLEFENVAQPTFVKTDREKNPWQVEIDRPVPNVVAMQLGDIAHSLRSALDVTMCDLALLANVKFSDMVYPFASSRERFAEMLGEPNKRQPFKKLGSDVIKIIKRSEPYVGGNTPLRGLHDLNNHDKHRMAVPFVSHVSTICTMNKMFSSISSQIMVLGGELVALPVGEPIADEYFVDHPSTEYIIRPKTMVFTFPANYVLFGDIITVMGNLIDYVDGLVQEFKAQAVS